LSWFKSDSATEGLRGTTPSIAVKDQQVQELFDNSGTWRQARIDLHAYAGQPDLRLRFDFSTAGTMNDTTEGAINSDFGEISNNTRSIRSQSNTCAGGARGCEGFYIDDIVVGFTERGEMVTSSGNNSGFFAVPQPPAAVAPNPELLIGPYQLEIRRAQEYASSGTKSVTQLSRLPVRL
jgi:hypothetical protein